MQFSANDRHIIVITGEYQASLSYAQRLISELDSIEIFGQCTDENSKQKKAQSYLGQELDAVIYDMHQSFNPNDFGAITGTIRGGGFLILLRPEKLPSSSLFLARFNQILENTSQVHFLRAEDKIQFLLPVPQIKQFSTVYATKDQEDAVAAIIKVATGHRRRPLVITSDRGRGKSAALGIAAAELAKQGLNNIAICAPSKKTAMTVFKHADLNSNDGENSSSYLTFYSPDELQQQKPKADLVLIDEAAAIPIPLLAIFLRHYSRIVFASTQHGYEGSGRGFAINFRKVLDLEAPQWKSYQLKTPVRWQKGDSLEQFTFDALLLNAEAVNESIIEKVTLDDCRFNILDKQDLLKNNERLKQLFGLLVSAHYQTKPSDLMQLFDDDSVSIYCLEANQAIVAVALLITEGNLEPKLSADIFAGKRRLQGHLVAQALASNVGIKTAPQLSGERISRIAVHSHLQNKGLGSFLIHKLIEQTEADYLSTCYGATKPLIQFWQKARFEAVHLGIKRDASSGAHSVTMLYPKNKKGTELSKTAQFNFALNFPHLLSDALSELESEIVFPLLPKVANKDFDAAEVSVLQAFAHESRGYENCLYLIWHLVFSKLTHNKTLSETEKKILIIKVLQKQSWSSLLEKMQGEITGKKQALAYIRQAVTKLL